MTATTLTMSPSCPLPLPVVDRVQLGHGSGGKMSAELLRHHFLPLLDNPVLRQLGDAAVVPVHGGDIAISTDTFVVSPLEFPGGNIGSLAVHGTLNDLAMMGAAPGSASQRNAERHGFRIAYTRIKWRLPQPGSEAAPLPA